MLAASGISNQVLVTCVSGKALQGTSQLYIQDPPILYVPKRTLCSEKSRYLVQPGVRTKQYGDRRFDVSAAVLRKRPADQRHTQLQPFWRLKNMSK